MGNGRRIYMVEDDSDMVEVVRWVVEAAGYQFSAASSAQEAMERLAGEQPDLVILDVMMEDLRAGFRVLKFMRDAGQARGTRDLGGVPVLMLSSISHKVRVNFSESTNNHLRPTDAFMEKPVKPRVLVETIARLLGERAPA
jgi:CheY-like chemotaxis protein